MNNIKDMQVEVRDWIRTILPVRNPTRTCIKLVTEAAELLDAVASGDVGSPEEMADVMILLLDIADQFGVDIEAEFYRKMEINRKRTWVIKNGSLTHDS